MFNKEAGKFGTTQVGGMCSFEKVNDEYGVSLYGEARVPKREEDICRCIMDLYRMNMLKFSFEISYSPNDVVILDGVQYVDASENNALTGMAIVSVPAYQESIALSLVAESEHKAEAVDVDEKVEPDVETVEETQDPDEKEGADKMT